MNCSYYKNEIDAPNDNPNHYDIHTCEIQDDILIHATNLSNTFALPQFMAQHNCEGQDPTDVPSAVATASQASCDHTIKPKCAHNPMGSPVQQFKFIHPIPKPRMTKTPFQIAVHVAYSPIASMNYKWTINLHDRYPLFQVMKSEGYIPPFLHILCITKHIPLCDSSVHNGTPFSVPSSSSETNRVSNSHSSLVTTSSPRMILGKVKSEVTKVLTHHVGKSEEYFHGSIGIILLPVCLSTSTAPHVDSCSRKLTGEGNTQSTLWLSGKVMKLIQLDTTSLKWIGELFMTQVSSFS